MIAKPNNWVYIFWIKNDQTFYDRTVSRDGLGIQRAKQRVEYLESLGYDAYYTIGTLPKIDFFS